MASDRRTGGRLEDHPDQLRAAFGRARRMDACCRTCLCSCALDPTRVAKSSPLRHQRHRAQRAIRRSPNAHRELARAHRTVSLMHGKQQRVQGSTALPGAASDLTEGRGPGRPALTRPTRRRARGLHTPTRTSGGSRASPPHRDPRLLKRSRRLSRLGAGARDRPTAPPTRRAPPPSHPPTAPL